ncbi:unnamed protein product [Urochloa decumbens]|uniref:F-box domain-containing protein n=1 Tax=Urochloa decumbens TaxID=240449 RepID=A0ABC8ZYP7_9POAL
MPGGLPADVLMKIFATLEVPDLVRAGSVCSSWLHAYNCLRKFGACIQPQTPSLIYTSKSSGASAAGFYSLLENKPYTFTLPDPPIRSRYLIGSAYGWIVTADERSELHLVNPITGDQIALPSVTTIEQVKPIYDNNGAIHMYGYSRYTGAEGYLDPPSVFRLDKLRDYIFYKAFLSSDPFTGNYIVVLIHHPYWQISFARGRDDHWTWLPYHACYTDCAFKDELLYATLVDGEIHAYDINDPSVKPRVVMEGLKDCPPLYKMYIAQAPCGDLLQIWKVPEDSEQEVEDVSEPDLDPPDDDEYFSVSEDGSEPELETVPYRRYTTAFKVYRVDLTAKKLVEISSLGDNVLFLGLNQSLCLCAKEYPQLKGNHIYFTDDNEYMVFGSKNKCREMGVFNLDNKMSEKIVSPRIWSNWPPPVWIVPNPRKMNLALLN